jgi:hypothetical protein
MNREKYKETNRQERQGRKGKKKERDIEFSQMI